MSRGRTVHRASTDRSISDSVSRARLTIMTRLVDDSGWIIWGGLETFGSAWRLGQALLDHLPRAMMSVPGSKISTIDDSPGTDSDRIVSTQATPLSISPPWAP